MSTSHFFAHLARMKLINRWPLMRNTQTENIAEHSLQVAMVAHMLATIDNQFFNGQTDPHVVATTALFHDCSEVLTGDLPTPVKYHNPAIAKEYKKIERLSEERLLQMIPPELQAAFAPLLCAELTPAPIATIVKDADTLCAYVKCLEELHCGNKEFKLAKIRLEEALQARMNPAMDYFIKTFIASFSLSLDELADTEH